ncbi:MAG: hypothetical protein ACXW5W_07145 [Candidatus Binatia bacterium]
MSRPIRASWPSKPISRGRDPTRTWFKNGFVKSLLQTGRRRDARLGDVPTLYELMDIQKTPDALRRMASVVLSSGGFGRPMVAPPGMFPDLARTIREGYGKMLKDPEFVTEVKKTPRRLGTGILGGDAEPGQGSDQPAAGCRRAGEKDFGKLMGDDTIRNF